MDPLEDGILPQLILIVTLIIMNAFFASAEMAVVSVNRNKIKRLSEDGNKKANLVERLLDEPTEFLSTIQVGITLAGFFSSASAATGLVDDFKIVLDRFAIPYSSQIALVLITIILSFFTLVFGELVPKQIALRKAEAVAMVTVRPILFISKITIPFVKLLSFTTSLITKILGLNKEEEEVVSEEEIRTMIETSHEQGGINEYEQEMIESIFEFNNKSARDIMTPRKYVFLLDINDSIEEHLEEIIENNYSRIPVYEENEDNIIGVLYIKDLFAKAYRIGFTNLEIKSLLHEPHFINETKTVDKLFRELQSSNKYFAILIDEFGGFSGIVTMEDLVEEVMGNISDEYDILRAQREELLTSNNGRINLIDN